MRIDCILRSRKRLAPILLMMAAAWSLASCQQEDALAIDIPEAGRAVPAKLRLTVGDFEDDTNGTRAYVTANTDENRIKDIWLFQFDATTGEELYQPRYLATTADSMIIEADLRPNTGDQQSLVCIVANTGDATWALDENGTTHTGFATYADLLSQTLPAAATAPFISSNMGKEGRAVPMFGVSDPIAIASNYYVSVHMYRMFSRVTLDVDVSYHTQLGMEIEDVSFGNIPNYCRTQTFASSDDYRAATASLTDTDWGTCSYGNVSHVTIYVPENLQGTVESMTDKQTATEGFPDHALYIDLKMGYGEETDPKTHTYRIYPGLNKENNFDIVRNHVYRMNVKITNLPSEQ